VAATGTSPGTETTSNFVGPVYIPNEPPKVESPTPNSGDVLQQLDNIVLGWTGSDPDGDTITYNVFFGDTLVDHCANISTSTCTLQETLEFGTSYFWKVEAEDSHGNTANGGPWGFSIRGNQRPYSPVNYQPAYGENGINYASVNLQWSWEDQPDPDGDTVTSDVYLSTVKSELVDLSVGLRCSDVSASTASCTIEGLEANQTYYWRVVTTDEFGSISKGFFGMFETQSFEAAFEVNQENGFAPLTINFTDISTGSIQSWLWDFGVQKENSTENETSSDQHPIFTFEETGTYPVILTVKDVDAQEKTATKDITVKTLEPVALIVSPGANTMFLDWSAESINTFVPDPTNTVVEFWRTPEATEDWQLIDTVAYMDSLISANQYFDGNTAEPKMVKDQSYCYYFKVISNEGGNTNLLTQTEEACDTFGAIRLFIDTVASAGPGDEVVIPVKIANAQELKIGRGSLSLGFNRNVISPENLSIVLSPLLIDEFGEPMYEFGNSAIEENADEATVTFQFDGNFDEELFGGQENFLWIKAMVSGEHQDTTELKWDKSSDKSFMWDVDSNPISLSFGNADFNVTTRRGIRDSKVQWIADGNFVVNANGRLGDPNLNSVVDSDDAQRVLRNIVDKDTYPLTKDEFAAADANGNGKIDANDAALILYYSFKREWPSVSASNSQNDSPMQISLGDISGESGAEMETTLSVENMSDFTSGEFILSYDPAVIAAITEVKRTRFTRRFSIIFADNGKGKVRIAMASREPVNGNGELVTVKLRLKAETMLRRGTRDGAATGKRSASLVLTQTQLYDPSGQNFGYQAKSHGAYP